MMAVAYIKSQLHNTSAQIPGLRLLWPDLLNTLISAQDFLMQVSSHLRSPQLQYNNSSRPGSQPHGRNTLPSAQPFPAPGYLQLQAGQVQERLTGPHRREIQG